MSKLGVLSRVILTLGAALALSSCGSSLSRKLSIESYDNLKIMGLSGAKIEIGVRNESCHKVDVRELSVTLREGDHNIGTATLVEQPTIGRRTTLEEVPTTWRFSDVDALYALTATNRLLDEEKNDAFVVDIEGVVKVSLVKRRFAERNIPLKALLNEIK
ncbi:MAG: hypothetical protein SNI51_06115 [Rikenellaceae bacterium]